MTNQRTKVFDDGRVCSRCRVYKLWANYYVSLRLSTGYLPHCKECAYKYHKLSKSYIGCQQTKQYWKKKRGVNMRAYTGFPDPIE